MKARHEKTGKERAMIMALPVLLVTSFSVLGCVTTPPASRIIYEDGNRFMRLEVNARSRRGEHHHPVAIPEKLLAGVLGTLSAHPRTSFTEPARFGYKIRPVSSAPFPAFSEPDIMFLASHLSQALAKATPLEEVVFYIQHRQNHRVLLMTSGAFFVQNDRLHLLVANFRHPTIGQVEMTEAKAHPLAVLAQHQYDIVPDDGGKKIPSHGWKALVTAFPQHIILSYQIDHSSHRVSKDEVKPSISSSPSSLSSSIPDKLRELESMRRERLISNKEYHRLRALLLKSYERTLPKAQK